MKISARGIGFGFCVAFVLVIFVLMPGSKFNPPRRVDLDVSKMDWEELTLFRKELESLQASTNIKRFAGGRDSKPLPAGRL
jgi:hypothetical protein